MDDPVQLALNRAAEEVTPEDIEHVIQYLRAHRAQHLSGVKVKKEKVEVKLEDLGLNIKPKITLAGRRF